MVLSVSRFRSNETKQMTDVKLWLLYSNTWNHLTVCKKRAQARLRMLSTKRFYKSYIRIYLIYMYKPDSVLTNLQWLIFHKTKPNQTLEIWGIWSTPSLPLLPGSLWPGVVGLKRVLSMGQIEQNTFVSKWLMLNCDCYIAIREML